MVGLFVVSITYEYEVVRKKVALNLLLMYESDLCLTWRRVLIVSNGVVAIDATAPATIPPAAWTKTTCHCFGLASSPSAQLNPKPLQMHFRKYCYNCISMIIYSSVVKPIFIVLFACHSSSHVSTFNDMWDTFQGFLLEQKRKILLWATF